MLSAVRQAPTLCIVARTSTGFDPLTVRVAVIHRAEARGPYGRGPDSPQPERPARRPIGRTSFGTNLPTVMARLDRATRSGTARWSRLSCSSYAIFIFGIYRTGPGGPVEPCHDGGVHRSPDWPARSCHLACHVPDFQSKSRM